MKVVALLTGRGNNTLKDKNVLSVLGKPLLYYPAMAAKNADKVTDLFVSSEDEKILTEANLLGYNKIERPLELARPDAQHIDAILHALEVMKNDYGVCPDILIVLLANAGIVKTEWINECVDILIREPEVSSVVPVKKDMDHHPYRAKRVDENGYLQTFFDFSGQKISTNRQDLIPNYYLCHNFWVLKISETIDRLPEGQQPWTFLGNKIKPFVIEESFDVHTEEDLKLTENWILKEKINYGE